MAITQLHLGQKTFLQTVWIQMSQFYLHGEAFQNKADKGI